MTPLLHAFGMFAAVREVVPARAQMATTLGFHIILACFGIALPTIVLIAEYIGIKRSDEVAMTLARRWSQALGVLVAVGAVIGVMVTPVTLPETASFCFLLVVPRALRVSPALAAFNAFSADVFAAIGFAAVMPNSANCGFCDPRSAMIACFK